MTDDDLSWVALLILAFIGGVAIASKTSASASTRTNAVARAGTGCGGCTNG